MGRGSWDLAPGVPGLFKNISMCVAVRFLEPPIVYELLAGSDMFHHFEGIEASTNELTTMHDRKYVKQDPSENTQS